MYRKFREDPSSVDPSWHEFLVDYNPEPTVETSTATDGAPGAPAPAAPPEPQPAPAPAAAPPAKAADSNGAGVPTAPAKTAAYTPAEGDDVRCCAAPPRRL